MTSDELEQRLAEVEAREAEVAKRERAVAAKGIRYNIYERVPLSLRSVDAVIVVCAAAIVALIAAGVYLGGR